MDAALSHIRTRHARQALRVIACRVASVAATFPGDARSPVEKRRGAVGMRGKAALASTLAGGKHRQQGPRGAARRLGGRRCFQFFKNTWVFVVTLLCTPLHFVVGRTNL